MNKLIAAIALLALPALASAQTMGASQGFAGSAASGGSGSATPLPTSTPAPTVTPVPTATPIFTAPLGVGQGGTGLTSATDDSVPVGTGTVYELKAIPNCPDSGGNHLNYDASTNTFSCGTS